MLFDGRSSNLYGYAGSDPVNFLDPSGLFVPCGPCAAVGFVVGGIYSGVSAAASSFRSDGAVDLSQVFRDALVGGAAGAVGGSLALIPGAGTAVGIGLGAGASAGLLTDLFRQVDSLCPINPSIDPWALLRSATIGATAGAVGAFAGVGTLAGFSAGTVAAGAAAAATGIAGSVCGAITVSIEALLLR